ncbi:MAG: O-antigen ligase family protein [Fibrobacteria bacterium]
MRLLLVDLIFAVWSLAALWQPALASALLLWVDIMAPLELAYSTGAQPLSTWALGVMLVSFAVNVAFRGFRPRITYFFWMWLLFFGWACVCTWVSPFPQSTDGLIRILKYQAPLLLISMSARTIKDARFLAYLLAVSLGVWGAKIGAGCLLHGMNNYMHIEGTQMGDNNFLSAGVVSILPILLYAATDYSGRYKLAVRFAWGIGLLLCLATVIFSNSRGAALGVLGNVVIYLALISKKKLRDIALVALVGGAVLMVLPQSFWNRMNTLQDVGTDKAESSARERLLLVKSTFRAVNDYPVFGVGPYSWVVVSNYYTGLQTSMQPHNIWLKCSVELGYPGLLIFISLILGTIIRLLRVRNQAYQAGQIRTGKLALALASCQIGYIISLTFLSNYDLEFQWAWLAVGNAFVGIWKTNRSALQTRALKKGRTRSEPAEPDSTPEPPALGDSNQYQSDKGNPA